MCGGWSADYPLHELTTKAAQLNRFDSGDFKNQRKPVINDFTNVLKRKETATDISKKPLGVESDSWRVIDSKG